MPRRWAHLLKNKSLHPQLRGQVFWIDEAGLLSARQMRGIFQLAEKQDCRVILSGDTRQHTSVERGDALRLLEKYAELNPAELTKIRRQHHEQVTVYTDDKARLAEAIQSSGARLTAHELLKLPAATKSIDPFESMLRERVAIPAAETLSSDSNHKKDHLAEKINPTESLSKSYQNKLADHFEPERPSRAFRFDLSQSTSLKVKARCHYYRWFRSDNEQVHLQPKRFALGYTQGVMPSCGYLGLNASCVN